MVLLLYSCSTQRVQSESLLTTGFPIFLDLRFQKMIAMMGMAMYPKNGYIIRQMIF